MTAEQACADYEFWAAEVRRLTTAIGNIICPHEGPPGSACFAFFSEMEVETGQSGEEGPPTRRLMLDEIEERVKKCPKCSELVRLIRARRYARKKFGIAKRRIRAIGKRMIASEPPERCESGCEAPVVAHDSEGVPLCAECAASLAESARTSTLEGE